MAGTTTSGATPTASVSWPRWSGPPERPLGTERFCSRLQSLRCLPGVPSRELQDLDVLGRVHLHELDKQVPQSRVLDVVQLFGQTAKFAGIRLLALEQLVAQLDDAVATDAEGFEPGYGGLLRTQLGLGAERRRQVSEHPM